MSEDSALSAIIRRAREHGSRAVLLHATRTHDADRHERRMVRPQLLAPELASVVELIERELVDLEANAEAVRGHVVTASE